MRRLLVILMLAGSLFPVFPVFPVWAADPPGYAAAGLVAPSVRRRVEAQYSSKALAERVEGDCTLHLVVDPEGKPEPSSVQVYRGIGYGLDERAVKAVRQWLFEPGTKDGKPVRFAVVVVVKFRLPGGDDLQK